MNSSKIEYDKFHTIQIYKTTKNNKLLFIEDNKNQEFIICLNKNNESCIPNETLFPYKKLIKIYNSDDIHKFVSDFPEFILPYLKHFNYPYGIGGYSYFKTWTFCKRQFYFRYILKIESKVKNNKAALGILIHKLISLTLKTKEEVDLKTFEEIYKSPDIDLTDIEYINLAWDLYSMWCIESKDFILNTYDILYVENSVFTFPLKNKYFIYVFKPDYILQHKKTGFIFMCELKTTSYRVDKIRENLLTGYQLDSYAYIWDHLKPEFKIDFFKGDILSYKEVKNYIKINDPEKEFIFSRNKFKEEMFTKSLEQIILEIQHKKFIYSRIIDPLIFIPKFSCCEGNNFKCEYQEICNLNLLKEDILENFNFQERKRIYD